MTKQQDGLKPRGIVEVFITEGKPEIEYGKLLKSGPSQPKCYESAVINFHKTKILDHRYIENIIVNIGKDKVVESLTTGFINVIARMAIGDRGTLPSDPTVPKVPQATQDSLFNEIYRDDIDSVVLDVGTPETHSVRFIKSFAAADIPITSYSNQANPVVNEVGLITADLISGNPLPRPPVAAPNPPDADEELFSLRTFNSVPFLAENDIAITIRYTIFVE
jgi:hypothetical protein